MSLITASNIKRLIRRAGYAAVVIGVAVSISTASYAQSSGGYAHQFFQSLVGDWIGTCEQSTDGQQAENKYFHGTIKQINPNTYTCKFDYYRQDARTGSPLKIGESSVTTTIGADGSVRNKITGKGQMMVEKKPKNQTHELDEVLMVSSSGLQGSGGGKLSVSGMPLGVGKNGKIKDAKSTWTLSNGVLSINQNLKATFKALFIKKSFDFAARYTARRGTDVASLMGRPARVSYKPAGR